MADNTKLLVFGGAAVAAYWYFYMRPQSAATPAPVSSGGGSPVVTDPNAITGANTVAGIQARVLAAAQAPAQGLGVDAWGWYLNNELTKLGKGPAPDPWPIFSAAIPGFDRGQPITGAQYWSVMTPNLKAATGLAGLGLFAGFR